MARGKKKPGTDNLFNVDDEEHIKQRLSEANERLMLRADELHDAVINSPETLSTFEEFEDAEQQLKRSEEIARDLSKNRLNDGRSFTYAAGVVKEFFGPQENRCKNLCDKLKKKISKYVMQQHQQATLATNTPYSNLASETEKSDAFSMPGNPIQNLPDIEWKIKDWEISELDLGELRLLLSESCIRNALNKHLEKWGKKDDFKGVTYEQAIK